MAEDKSVVLVQEDELLSIWQVTFLIGKKRNTTEAFIRTGKIKVSVQGKKTLVRSSDLREFVTIQISKYMMAMKYLDTDDDKKDMFLREHGFCGKGCEAYVSKPTECLTIPQTAFLLQKTRQSIFELCRKGKIRTIVVSRTSKRKKLLIPVMELVRIIEKNMNCFRKAMEYFECKNKDNFWDQNKELFAEQINTERMRYREQQVQERNCYACSSGKENGQGTGTLKGKISGGSGAGYFDC